MKIGLHVPFWPLGFTANGILTYVSQLVPALRQLGHKVYVLAGYIEDGHDDPNVTDLRTFESSPSLWSRAMFRIAPETVNFRTKSSAIASAVRELVARHDLDVIEMEDSFGWSYSITQLGLLPVVVKLHGPWFLTGKYEVSERWAAQNRHREKWEGRGIKHAQVVTAPSAAVLQAVKDHYGLHKIVSRVIANPIKPAGEVETWDSKTCGESLLFVGRFDTLKGGDLVLRTFSELAQSYPRLRLRFVGPDKGIKGADGTVVYFDQFVRTYVPEWCRSRIEYLGQLNHAAVMSLRHQSYATLIASRQEAFPYSVLEAMSFGCPLVATAVGGIRELIHDQRNGLLVQNENVKAMVAACRKLLDDPLFAAQLGRQAWRDCGDLYRPEFIAEQTAAVYREAIHSFKLRLNGAGSR